MSIESNGANAVCQPTFRGYALRARNFLQVKRTGKNLREIRRISKESSAWPTAGRMRHLINQAPHKITFLDPKTGEEKPLPEGCVRLLDMLVGMASESWNTGEYAIKRCNTTLAEKLGIEVRTVQVRLQKLEWAGAIARTYSHAHQRSQIDLAPLLGLLPILQDIDAQIQHRRAEARERYYAERDTNEDSSGGESLCTRINTLPEINISSVSCANAVDETSVDKTESSPPPERLSAQDGSDNQCSSKAEPAFKRLTAQRVTNIKKDPPIGGYALQEERVGGGGDISTDEYYRALGDYVGREDLGLLIKLSPRFAEEVAAVSQKTDTADIDNLDVGRAIDALRLKISFNQAQFWMRLQDKGLDAISALILSVEADIVAKARYLSGILRKPAKECNPWLSLKKIHRKRMSPESVRGRSPA